MSNRFLLSFVLLALLVFLLTPVSSCKKTDVRNEELFVTPEPENSPKEIEKRILDNSTAPLLASSHITEDINLCFKCHPEAKLVTEDPNLIFSHQRHFAQGIVCHTCHRDEGARVYTPVKEDCIACHTQRGIPTTGCRFTHRRSLGIRSAASYATTSTPARHAMRSGRSGSDRNFEPRIRQV